MPQPSEIRQLRETVRQSLASRRLERAETIASAKSQSSLTAEPPENTDLVERLRGAQRIAVIGGPNVGKTTLGRHIARVLGLRFRECDDLIGHLGWSESSQYISDKWMSGERWVIVGASAVRALRKRLAADPGKPADVVVYLTKPKAGVSPAQESMASGVNTVFAGKAGDPSKPGIERELKARGVEVIRA